MDSLPRITGIVREAEGAAIEGASVSLHLVEESRSTEDGEILRPGRVFGETRTDASGRFTLVMPERSVLADEEFVLVATREGFAPDATYGVTPWQLDTLEPGISLDRGVLVEGAVQDHERAVNGARVDLFEVTAPGMGGLGISRWVSGQRTDADGRFRFLASAFAIFLDGVCVTASADQSVGRACVSQATPGVSRNRAEPRSIVLALPEPDDLERGPATRRLAGQETSDGIRTVTGRVLDSETGAAVTTFAVEVRRYPPDDEGPNRRRVIQTVDGRFTVYGLIQAQTDLTIRAHGWVERTVPIGPGGSCGDVALDKGATVRGRVETPDGHALAGARVHVQPSWKPLDPLASVATRAQWCEFPHAFSAPDGSYEIRHVAPGAHRIVAAHRDFAPSISSELRVTGAPVSAGVLAVAAGGRIEGQVDETLSDRTVELSYNSTGHVRLGGLALPIRGHRFEIGGLPAGTYDVAGPQVGCLGTSVTVKVVPGTTTFAMIERP